MNGSSNPAPVQKQRDHSGTPAPPTVHYRSAGITITTEFVESAGRRYSLVELLAPRRAQGASWWQPRRYELWATFQGERVRLFVSRDGQRFNQVCRALVRAREHAGLA